MAGLVYASLYVPDGWLGQFLAPLGIEGAYSRLGIVLVLTFTGFPFVVRTVQPVLQLQDVGGNEHAVMLEGDLVERPAPASQRLRRFAQAPRPFVVGHIDQDAPWHVRPGHPADLVSLVEAELI